MIKVTILSPELEQQIERLKRSEDVLEKHYGRTLQDIVTKLEGRIRPTIPVLSGKAQRTFGSKVAGRDLSKVGRVGWFDEDDPWYPNILEHGARPHPLNKGSNIRTKKRAAIFERYISSTNRPAGLGTHVYIGGRWVTMQHHPGISKRGFMAAGYSAMKAEIDAKLAASTEAVVKELGIQS